MENPKIVQPQSMTYEAILNDLFNYVKSLPDSKRWLDYFQFSEGATLTELMAGVSSFLRYHNLMAWRETSHLTARLKSTIYGMANLRGYPPNRMKGARLRIRFNSTQDVFWPRNTVIGTVGSAKISLIQAQQINIGSNTIDVALGSWVTKSLVSTTSQSFAEFKWTIGSADPSSQVSSIEQIDNELIQLLVNDVEVKWSRYTEQLGINSVGTILRTLSDRLSVIFGTDDLGQRINERDAISLNYLAVDNSNLDTTTYVTSQVKLNIQGSTVTQVDTLSRHAPEDSLQKIVTLLPGYHASQRQMTNYRDSEALLRSYAGLVSSKWVYGTCVVDGTERYAIKKEVDCRALSGTWTPATTTCCESTLSYLFEDEHIATIYEKEQIYLYLDDFRMPGAGIKLIDPKAVTLNLTADIVIVDGLDVKKLQDQINAAIDLYTKQLGITFKVENLRNAIKNLTGVKYVYIHAPTADLELASYQYLKRGSLRLTFSTDTQKQQHYGNSASTDGYVYV